jgi:hypothetical protein
LGFTVREPSEAQQENSVGATDWYPFYCQALAAGISPDEFGSLTYSQIVALIDAEKLRRYNDRYFDVTEIVSNMDEEGVRKALYGGGSGGASRNKLVEKMLRPFMPSFMLPEVRLLREKSPIDGLTPKTAEGIMQAIERKLLNHTQWLTIHPVWQNIMVTASKYK